MKGHLAPRNRPSESQPHVSANATKIAVVTSGTADTLVLDGFTFNIILTVVDFWYRECHAGHRIWLFVEALEPVSHALLRGTIIPHHI